MAGAERSWPGGHQSRGSEKEGHVCTRGVQKCAPGAVHTASSSDATSLVLMGPKELGNPSLPPFTRLGFSATMAAKELEGQSAMLRFRGKVVLRIVLSCPDILPEVRAPTLSPRLSNQVRPSA